MSSAYWLLRILWDINNDADNDEGDNSAPEDDDEDDNDGDDDDTCSVVRLDILVNLDIGCIILSIIISGNENRKFRENITARWITILIFELARKHPRGDA
jgi:hypothetical protein